MRASSLITGLVLIVAAATAASEPIYKWRDERGGVHYGEKPPPPGVRTTLVDTQPNLSQGASKSECVGTNCPPSRSEDAPGIRRDEAPARPAGYPVPSNGLPQPRGLDFDVYVRLKSGMSEGELLCAGPSDFEAVDNLRGRIGKSYYYFPTSSNPYTTIVTLRGGRIFNIERVKKF